MSPFIGPCETPLSIVTYGEEIFVLASAPFICPANQKGITATVTVVWLIIAVNEEEEKDGY